MTLRIPYAQVARITKTRGKKGEVAVQGASGLPFCLYEGLEVYIVPPVLEGVRCTRIAHLNQTGETAGYIALAGIDSMSAAEELVGRSLLAATEDLDLEGALCIDEWLDREVVDESYGPLGAISEIFETPAHEVAVVNGERGEVLIPLVEEFFTEIPEDPAAPLRTRIPEGLVD